MLFNFLFQSLWVLIEQFMFSARYFFHLITELHKVKREYFISKKANAALWKKEKDMTFSVVESLLWNVRSLSLESLCTCRCRCFASSSQARWSFRHGLHLLLTFSIWSGDLASASEKAFSTHSGLFRFKKSHHFHTCEQSEILVRLNSPNQISIYALLPQIHRSRGS